MNSWNTNNSVFFSFRTLHMMRSRGWLVIMRAKLTKATSPKWPIWMQSSTRTWGWIVPSHYTRGCASRTARSHLAWSSRKGPGLTSLSTRVTSTRSSSQIPMSSDQTDSWKKTATTSSHSHTDHSGEVLGCALGSDLRRLRWKLLWPNFSPSID